jgi:D-glycero-D-manno-heptose 1,7-bisphosphate phosphatase
MTSSNQTVKKAIFLDRDGTINIDVPYLKDFSLFKLVPGTAEALRFFVKKGYKLFIVTNQSGIARGYFSEEEFQHLQNQINEYLLSLEIPITDVAYCPHHSRGIVEPYNIDCDCRKPSPKMIVDLAKKHAISLSDSFMIGDKKSDVEAGERAGVQSIRVLSGDQSYLKEESHKPFYKNLLEFSKSSYFS